jgi:hypothetical protein
MALWSNTDANTSAPKYAVAGGLGVSANGFTTYGNTSIDAFVTDLALGTFGVDSTEAGITTGEGKKIQHAGWNLRKSGTGPVLSITANTGATSPDGNVYITFTGGGTDTITANAQVFVNSISDVITTIVVNDGGKYSSTPTAAAVNSDAVFTVTMGGRANRVQYETLVAMGSMTGDGDDDAIFPDA